MSSLNGSVRLAREEDATQIVDLFLNEYDRYFGKFSDPEKMEEAISEMHEGIEDGSPWAGVFVIDNDGDVEGVSALKQNRPGWSELSSTVIAPDSRGESIGGESLYQLLHQARENFDEDFYPDEKRYTQTVSFTGKSQKGSLDAGFVPVGYSDGQFFEANKGDGRISTVYMIHSANDYTDEGTVYVPEGPVRDATEVALENIEESDIDIERELEESSERPDTVSVLEQNAEAIGQARLTVLEDEDQYEEWSYDELLDWIESMKSRDEIEWMNLEIDAGTPLASSLVEDTNLYFERFQPDGLKTDEWHDILGLQQRPSGTRERYFIEEAMDVIDASGIPYEQQGVETYSGTDVYEVELLDNGL